MLKINASMPGVPATDYATSWANSWTDPANDLLSAADLALLAHVNCAYLSSPHRPPTLLALKQHAQSLAVLIQRISVSHAQSALVDERGAGDSAEEQFAPHDAFDWLNDLRTPYTNDDASHHLPIRGLLNTVAHESESDGPQTHCPLHRVTGGTAKEAQETAATTAATMPFATHQNLVLHANACLEILDHEYSATGGLVSILPSAYDGDAAQLEAARGTLLGQWLLHHQDLVSRLHELEINYSNALAACEGRAVFPLQIDTADDAGGLGVASAACTPQDELVLVGHRSHLYERIHALLDRAEAHVESKQKLWWARGVSGERTWQADRGGGWYARGLIPLDLGTRIFRVKGEGRGGKLYMMPGVKQNAALAHLLEMEARPTVVSVVTPKWAERATALEMRMRQKMTADGDGREREEDVGVLRDMVRVKEEELELANTAVRFYEQRVGMDAKGHMKDLLGMVSMYKEKIKKLESMEA